MAELGLRVLTFSDSDGAEQALAALRAQGVDEPWVEEVGVVERHTSGRVSVRGTYAGYYFNADEGNEPLAGAALGGLTGALIGLIGTPIGLVIGGALGAAAGGAAGHAAERQAEGALYDEIRRVLDRGTSAAVLIAAAPTLDTMSAALEDDALARAVDRERSPARRPRSSQKRSSATRRLRPRPKNRNR
ncbi:MAG: DUF1269 domain-containing protein [Thermoleophilia bacterium]|nr:DUF1269 domain-containing protein [Thermoleophilia bacterium]